ncbi:uncharacterized protein RJT20DRAFT_124625 [Scheffersomyces xylosifermentans]|uniref:uncharacterized protein n=1 Tax=Scheffersomyces xylosifermentans TaxID=1304137 RepID=UPI00315CB67E
MTSEADIRVKVRVSDTMELLKHAGYNTLMLFARFHAEFYTAVFGIVFKIPPQDFSKFKENSQKEILCELYSNIQKSLQIYLLLFDSKRRIFVGEDFQGTQAAVRSFQLRVFTSLSKSLEYFAELDKKLIKPNQSSPYFKAAQEVLSFEFSPLIDKLSTLEDDVANFQPCFSDPEVNTQFNKIHTDAVTISNQLTKNMSLFVKHFPLDRDITYELTTLDSHDIEYLMEMVFTEIGIYKSSAKRSTRKCMNKSLFNLYKSCIDLCRAFEDINDMLYWIARRFIREYYINNRKMSEENISLDALQSSLRIDTANILEQTYTNVLSWLENPSTVESFNTFENIEYLPPLLQQEHSLVEKFTVSLKDFEKERASRGEEKDLYTYRLFEQQIGSIESLLQEIILHSSSASTSTEKFIKDETAVEQFCQGAVHLRRLADAMVVNLRHVKKAHYGK